MIRLAWVRIRSGQARAGLLVACGALIAALLLVAVSLALLPAYPDEQLFELVRDPDLRVGTAFAVLLLGLPPLLLLYQVVRLGTAARERGLSALRVAGATPRQARAIGALEVGLPALAGGLLGWPLFLVLRALLGADRYLVVDGVARTIGLVPTSVAPSWWQVLCVAAAVGLAGASVGWATARSAAREPWSVSRRRPRAAPRPWGLVGIASGAALMGVGLWSDTLGRSGPVSVVVAVVAISLATLGILGLGSWLAYQMGRFAERSATSPAALLAARRLSVDPRAPGRAACAMGAIGLVAGGAGAVAADLSGTGNSHDPFYTWSLALVAAAAAAALAVVVGSLAVHSAESLLDHRRSSASLVATGFPAEVLERARLWEVGLATLPSASIGVLLGWIPLALAFQEIDVPGWLALPVVLAITLGLVGVGGWAAVRVTRPWALRAMAPANLRTE